jgi:hypothetical protein
MVHREAGTPSEAHDRDGEGVSPLSPAVAGLLPRQGTGVVAGPGLRVEVDAIAGGAIDRGGSTAPPFIMAVIQGSWAMGRATPPKPAKLSLVVANGRGAADLCGVTIAGGAQPGGPAPPVTARTLVGGGVGAVLAPRQRAGARPGVAAGSVAVQVWPGRGELRHSRSGPRRRGAQGVLAARTAPPPRRGGGGDEDLLMRERFTWGLDYSVGSGCNALSALGIHSLTAPEPIP